MIDLWTLLVVNLFQSFWMAVVALCVLFWIMFTIGRVSQVTMLNFMSIFILAMAIGYGYEIVSILITISILTIHFLAIPKLINS